MDQKEQLPLYNDVIVLSMQIAIKVDKEEHKGGLFDHHIVFRITLNDKNGLNQIWRRYNDFLLLREKLVLRWPGCIIPPIPKTAKVGNTEAETIRNRKKFLNNFLTKITQVPEIYYGEEF